MKQRLLLFFIVLSGIVAAQSQTVDFGDLKRSTQRYADITIRNFAEKTVHLTKIEHSPELVYRVNQDYIRPDSTFTIRVQVNPDTTGAFNHVLRVYLSDSELPIELRVVGNVLDVPNYRNLLEQKCPEFETEEEKEKRTEFTVVSVDAETQEVITKSTMTIIQNGKVSESWVTGSTGSLHKSLPPGFLYFVVSHPGYETQETGVFVTPEVETVYIPLKRDPQPVRVKWQPEEEVEAPQLTEHAEKVPEDQLEKTLSEQINEEREPAGPVELGSLPPLQFDTLLFRPVNIVFVLDMSSSMKMGEKMNLLKYALNELVGHLRDVDRISFVTYAEGARVYLKSTPCSEKELIGTKIDALSADGQSSSTKGIKLGYKELAQNMHPEQTNMVIVITDGAFNKYSNDYQDIIRKYADQNVVFSVVGIQCRSTDEQNMKEAAVYGNGRYVPVRKLVDAQNNLLQEIRLASFRGNSQ